MRCDSVKKAFLPLFGKKDEDSYYSFILFSTKLRYKNYADVCINTQNQLKSDI